jgi:hypothetical protein
MKNISTASTDQPMSTFDQIKEVVVKNVRGTMDCLQKLFSSLCCMKVFSNLLPKTLSSCVL